MHRQVATLDPVVYPAGMIEAILDYFIEVADRDPNYFRNLIYPQKNFEGRLFFKLKIGGQILPSGINLDDLFKSNSAKPLILAFGQRATRIQPLVNVETATECSTLVNEFFEHVCGHPKWLTFLGKIAASVQQPADLQRLKIKLAGSLGHKFLSALENAINVNAIICELTAPEMNTLNKIIMGFITTYEIKPEITFHQTKQKVQGAIARKFNMNLLITLIESDKDKGYKSISEEINRLKTSITEIHASDDFNALEREGWRFLIMQLHGSLEQIIKINKRNGAQKFAIKEFSNALMDYLSSQYHEGVLFDIRQTAVQTQDNDAQNHAEIIMAKSLLQVMASFYNFAYEHGDSNESRKLYNKLLSDISAQVNPAAPGKDLKSSPRGVTSLGRFLSPRATSSPILIASSPRAASPAANTTSSPRVTDTAAAAAASPRSSQASSPLAGIASPRAAEPSALAVSTPRMALSPRIALNPNHPNPGLTRSATSPDARQVTEGRKKERVLKYTSDDKKTSILNTNLFAAKPDEEKAPPRDIHLNLPPSPRHDDAHAVQVDNEQPAASPGSSNSDDEREYTSRLGDRVIARHSEGNDGSKFKP